MFKSATVTLTFWYVLLSMGLSLLFSGVLYHFSTNELSEALHNQYHILSSNDYDGDNRTGVSDRELNTRSQHLLQDLIYFNILVFVGSGIASYILARRTLRPIEAAHQAQIRFTAEASHELRTPLAAMKADTEATLMERGDAAVLRRTLQGNLKDIEKLETLTNHLLEIARYKSQAVPALEDIDLDNLIQKVLGQFRQAIRANRLKVKVSSVPVRVKGDQQGLRQLITIVLDNAIKYSRPKGVINLTLTKANKDAVIIIEDAGIGIRAEDLPHIFERFYRSQNASGKQNTVAGYGLGLPLAKEIVDLHKGTIEVHSEEDQGARVTIKLPLS